MPAISLETYSVCVRNTAMGIFTCANTIFSVLGSLAGGFILEKTNDNSFFIFVFSITLGLAGISASFVLETKEFNPEEYFERIFDRKKIIEDT